MVCPFETGPVSLGRQRSKATVPTGLRTRHPLLWNKKCLSMSISLINGNGMFLCKLAWIQKLTLITVRHLQLCLYYNWLWRLSLFLWAWILVLYLNCRPANVFTGQWKSPAWLLSGDKLLHCNKPEIATQQAYPFPWFFANRHETAKWYLPIIILGDLFCLICGAKSLD